MTLHSVHIQRSSLKMWSCANWMLAFCWFRNDFKNHFEFYPPLLVLIQSDLWVKLYKRLREPRTFRTASFLRWIKTSETFIHNPDSSMDVLGAFPKSVVVDVRRLVFRRHCVSVALQSLAGVARDLKRARRSTFVYVLHDLWSGDWEKAQMRSLKSFTSSNDTQLIKFRIEVTPSRW